MQCSVVQCVSIYPPILRTFSLQFFELPPILRTLILRTLILRTLVLRTLVLRTLILRTLVLRTLSPLSTVPYLEVRALLLEVTHLLPLRLAFGLGPSSGYGDSSSSVVVLSVCRSVVVLSAGSRTVGR